METSPYFTGDQWYYVSQDPRMREFDQPTCFEMEGRSCCHTEDKAPWVGDACAHRAFVTHITSVLV